MKKVTFYCDLCGVKITKNKPSETARNVDLTMGSFRVSVEVLNCGCVTDLCRECRIEIVSDAILEADPYALIDTYKGKKSGENGQTGLI